MSLLQIVANSRQWRKYTLNVFTCKFESQYLQTLCISLVFSLVKLVSSQKALRDDPKNKRLRRRLRFCMLYVKEVIF